jgi:hypothetical protein
MELIFAGLGGAFIVFLLLARGGASSSGCGGGCATSSPVNTSQQGASVQFLSSGSPAGVDFHPPQPSRPVTYSQQRVRPDGPMYIYPISNVGQGVTTPPKSKLTLSQPRY